MKALQFSALTYLLGVLVLNASVFPSMAQQDEADRKLLTDTRAKAEKGDAVAQYELAKRYGRGEGVSKDNSEMLKWYHASAEQGYAEAQYTLGWAYELPWDGVTQDRTESIKWFRMAADQGFPQALETLGDAYFWGRGVPKDEVEGARLYRMAAEQGRWTAQHSLGLCYRDGTGVPQDLVEAYKWLNLARAQAPSASKETKGVDWRWLLNFKITALTDKMNPQQIVVAQRLSTEFVPVKNRATNGQDRSRADLESPKSTGSGFAITEDGFLVSNAHVVKTSLQVRLVTSAGLIAAKVVKVDAANDLALLKAEGRFAALPVAASRGVKLGGTVATVGFP